MEIHLNDDGIMTVSGLFDEAISDALAVRPKLWAKMKGTMQEEHLVSDEVLARLEELYCACQIDMRRVMLVLENGGRLNGIVVDAKPQEALEGQNQMLNDIWENNRIVARSLRDKYGIEETRLSNPEEVARFNEEREILRAEGKLLPGLTGL